MEPGYFDTFITVAPDCPATAGTEPPEGRKPTIARIQYELIAGAPYTMTQADVLWAGRIRHRGLEGSDASDEARAAFFAKPQPCLRSSPLPKRYGWGLHFDAAGRVALVGVETGTYAALAKPSPDGPRVLAAMRSRRA